MKLRNYSFGLVALVHIAMTIAFAMTVPFYFDGIPMWAYGNWDLISDKSFWGNMTVVFVFAGAPLSVLMTHVLMGVLSLPSRLLFGK